MKEEELLVQLRVFSDYKEHWSVLVIGTCWMQVKDFVSYIIYNFSSSLYLESIR